MFVKLIAGSNLGRYGKNKKKIEMKKGKEKSYFIEMYEKSIN